MLKILCGNGTNNWHIITSLRRIIKWLYASTYIVYNGHSTCSSVHSSVYKINHLSCVKMAENIVKLFHLLVAPAILVFYHQMLWQNSNGVINGGIKCRRGKKNLRCLTGISQKQYSRPIGKHIWCTDLVWPWSSYKLLQNCLNLISWKMWNILAKLCLLTNTKSYDVWFKLP